MPAVFVDRPVLGSTELHPFAVLEIGHVPPRRGPNGVPFRRRDADVGRSFLELHRITTRTRRRVDKLASDVEIAVVVDPDLRRDVRGLPVADEALADTDG